MGVNTYQINWICSDHMKVGTRRISQKKVAKYFVNAIKLSLYNHTDGLVQDCIISTADTPEILQFCSKPSISLYIITVIQPSLFTLVKTSFKMHYRYYCPNSGTINAYVVDKTVKIYDNICSYLCRHLLFYRSCKSPTRAHHDGMVGINESPPNAAYMCQWIGSALVQIMVCRLFGTKPLSKPMLGYCPLDHQEQT